MPLQGLWVAAFTTALAAAPLTTLKESLLSRLQPLALSKVGGTRVNERLDRFEHPGPFEQHDRAPDQKRADEIGIDREFEEQRRDHVADQYDPGLD